MSHIKIKTELSFHMQDVVNSIEEKLTLRLTKVGVYLQAYIVESFGNPPPEPDGKGGVKKNSSKKWKQGHPSDPGDPPNVQTGMLRRSIMFEKRGHKGLELLVGSSLQPQGDSEHSYAWWLEHGTSKMAPRPYLRPALHNNQLMIESMMSGKV